MDTALTHYRLIAFSSSIGQPAKGPLVNYVHSSPVANGALVDGNQTVRCSRSFFVARGQMVLELVGK